MASIGAKPEFFASELAFFAKSYPYSTSSLSFSAMLNKVLGPSIAVAMNVLSFS